MSATTNNNNNNKWEIPQGIVQSFLAGGYIVLILHVLYMALKAAYDIRLHAIEEYGRVIHEFDPYFNYRATEYLYEHGWSKFATWFDYMVWYPLGRPVGTTIYPGMQVTSVFIKHYLLPHWSVNDICVFVPVWFGVLATFFTAMLAYECSVGITLTTGSTGGPPRDPNTPHNNNTPKQESLQQTYGQPFGSILHQIPLVNVVYTRILLPLLHMLLNTIQTLTGSTWGFRSPSSTITSTLASTPALECAIATAIIMSILPAHIMRSVGGGYDNESIAMTAMTFTFYAWVRSLRGNATPNYTWSILAGIAYFYMVAAWGGYVFVLNLIGVHASLLVLLGRYTTKLHRAYTLFYAIGTTLAIQVPVVGWTPLKSLEQLGPLVAFVAFQLIEVCQLIARHQQLNKVQTWKLRIMVFAGAGLVAVGIGYVLAQTGYFGPISSRVRGLFVQHTKTGNPLVDSVAEHQPATAGAYFQYLHNVCYIAPLGFILVALFQFHDASSFLLVYGAAAYFFSHKMVRLILLTAPIASVLGGLTLGRFMGYIVGALWGSTTSRPSLLTSLFLIDVNHTLEEGLNTTSGGSTTSTSEEDDRLSPSSTKTKTITTKKHTKSKKHTKKSSSSSGEQSSEPVVTATPLRSTSSSLSSDNYLARIIRFGVCMYAIREGIPYAQDFQKTSQDMAVGMSHPSIIMKGTTRDGRQVTVDDYREAYWWLRDHTPDDARIMAWWDYGYQITAIANRTTIADGNTWNHEHIALLGKTLTTDMDEGYEIARHMADYVLVWGGGGGDDLAKSPHLARIANSVYREHCPGDPTCRAFGFVDRNGTPSPMMERSFLYRLHGHKIKPGVEADPSKFQEMFRSKYGKVRIFKLLGVSQESKEWVKDPKNRVCDVPGSWFCPGQYPPALQYMLDQKKDFAQLEDFNRGGEGDDEYQKQYFENLQNSNLAKKRAAEAAKTQEKDAPPGAGGVNGEEHEAPPQQQQQPPRTTEQIAALKKQRYNTWENSEMSTNMWKIISSNSLQSLKDWMAEDPSAVFCRSEDGRGPMWWAFENRRQEMVKIFMDAGVPHTDKDAKGMSPVDLLEGTGGSS
mmetsp:Transcript_1295/g.2039  ORF Transcript_1295/g.2039 Transcript_1295/m.2039 type:complete len:1078 (+) Transcript_1295:168-3401(+)